MTGPAITAILGSRKCGKTTVSEILKSMHPESARLSMMAFGINDFCNLHEMSLESFWQRDLREENRSLYNVFSEHQRKKNPRIFMEPFLNYIKKLPAVIVDDVMYYNELEELIKMKARIILITTKDDTKKLRGWVPSMSRLPMEMEVSSISADMIKHWRNVTIINNDVAINDLRFNLGNI